MIGNITALLKPEHREQGYGLSEDEDFVYLWQSGKIKAVFSVHKVSIKNIEEVISENKG